jgi:hypothetical protein
MRMIRLQDIPGDMVTTSGSGLDPHITFQNATYQLDRVSSKWAADLKRNPVEVRTEVADILEKNSFAPSMDWREKRWLMFFKSILLFAVNMEYRNKRLIDCSNVF